MQIERGGDGSDGSYLVTGRAQHELTALRTAFEREHAVRVEAMLGPGLLDEMRQLVATAEWAERDDSWIARESTMHAPGVLARIMFMVNDPRMLAFTRELTGVSDILVFSGRIYRFAAGGSHFDSWHDDFADGRRVALSLNLSDGPIAGGELKIRPKGAEDATTFAYGQPGDALFFRVDSALEHQVQRVTSTTPRTALAGWFLASPPPGRRSTGA